MVIIDLLIISSAQCKYNTVQINSTNLKKHNAYYEDNVTNNKKKKDREEET